MESTIIDDKKREQSVIGLMILEFQAMVCYYSELMGEVPKIMIMEEQAIYLNALFNMILKMHSNVKDQIYMADLLKYHCPLSIFNELLDYKFSKVSEPNLLPYIQSIAS